MKPTKVIAIISVVCACVAASSLNAATLPAGTTITVSTVSAFSSKTVVGRSFEAKLAQDVSVNGHVLMKAGSKAFGKIASSRYNPRKNDPLTVELTSVSVNGRNVRGKDEYVPAGKPAGDGASGAVWSYSRHASDYPRNLDAVPASATSDVVAAASSCAISTRRLCDSGWRGGRQSEI